MAAAHVLEMNEAGTMTAASTAAAASDSEEEEESGYFDVMMIGKTGSGKSTVGNRLLDIDPETKTLFSAYRDDEDISNVIKEWGDSGDRKHYFEVGDGSESVTTRCKVLSNERHKDRVLDTRGFADSENSREDGVIKGNLQSFRWILQAQKQHDLRFSRVLYFLPSRGPPERADGTLQEEIGVMHTFFGQQIFDVMVLIVTNNKRERYQQAGFSDEDFKETKEVFQHAFKLATGTDLPKYPPVVYLAFNEDPFKKVIGADVISDAERLYFSPEFETGSSSFQWEDGKFSASVSVKSEITEKQKKRILHNFRGKSFKFEDRCARCAIKLVQRKLPSDKYVPVEVIDKTGDKKAHEESYCHAFFIPKYSQSIRIAGGVAHIITLGIGKVYEHVTKKKSWPWFTNSEEKCASCSLPPGSTGCSPVNKTVKICGVDYMITHSSELDTIQLVEDEN